MNPAQSPARRAGQPGAHSGLQVREPRQSSHVARPAWQARRGGTRRFPEDATHTRPRSRPPRHLRLQASPRTAARQSPKAPESGGIHTDAAEDAQPGSRDRGPGFLRPRRTEGLRTPPPSGGRGLGCVGRHGGPDPGLGPERGALPTSRLRARAARGRPPAPHARRLRESQRLRPAPAERRILTWPPTPPVPGTRSTAAHRPRPAGTGNRLAGLKPAHPSAHWSFTRRLQCAGAARRGCRPSFREEGHLRDR